MRGAIALLVGIVVGLIVGTTLSYRGSLSRDDVREAAEQLRPPGFELRDVESGYVGHFPPPKGPYFVALNLRGGGSTEERERAVRATVSRHGWQVRRSVAQAAIVLTLKRHPLEGTAGLRFHGETDILIEYPNQFGHRIAYAGAGALIGIVTGLLGVVKDRGVAPPIRPPAG